MTWESQQTGIASRPDLVGFLDGKPFMAIENKVDAPFTVGQLKAHGKWIAHESKGEGALVCLTARHTPPSDFLDGSSRKYGVNCKQRKVCSWSHIERWLKRHEQFEMASEFSEFLREESMDAIRLRDFAHLKGYLENEVDRKLRATMDWAFFHAVRPVIGQSRKPELKFMDGCVYSLYRFRKSPAKDIEIQWGFSPGNNDQCFDRDFGSEVVGFVGMWAPNGRLKAFTGQMRPWIRIWGGDFWVQTISAKQLAAKPDPADAFSL